MSNIDVVMHHGRSSVNIYFTVPHKVLEKEPWEDGSFWKLLDEMKTDVPDAVSDWEVERKRKKRAKKERKGK